MIGEPALHRVNARSQPIAAAAAIDAETCIGTRLELDVVAGRSVDVRVERRITTGIGRVRDDRSSGVGTTDLVTGEAGRRIGGHCRIGVVAVVGDVVEGAVRVTARIGIARHDESLP